MILEVEKTVKEQIEIQTPCWRKNGGDYYYVGENAVLLVRDLQITIWSRHSASGRFYNDYARQAFDGTGIAEQEFTDKYNEVVASFASIIHPVKVAV
jgi:hypothetical protein